jgi:hypothetical protein
VEEVEEGDATHTRPPTDAGDPPRVDHLPAPVGRTSSMGVAYARPRAPASARSGAFGLVATAPGEGPPRARTSRVRILGGAKEEMGIEVGEG